MNMVMHNEAVQEQEKEEKKEQTPTGEEKRHSPDQEALSEIAKEAKRKGVNSEEADILLEWSKELEMKTLDHRGEPHWGTPPKDHIHIGNQNHIPIKE